MGGKKNIENSGLRTRSQGNSSMFEEIVITTALRNS
jgi:hypothetical protein